MILGGVGFHLGQEGYFSALVRFLPLSEKHKNDHQGQQKQEMIRTNLLSGLYCELH